MTDNQLFTLIFGIVRAGLASRGILNAQVMQAYPPTRQGAPSVPSVIIHKLFDDPVGHTARKTKLVVPPPSVWDNGETVWDGGNDVWDQFISIWDNGNSIWDGGRTAWDGQFQMRRVEEQAWQSTYQVNALSVQNPNDVNQLTASDIVRSVRSVLQSSATIDLLQKAGVGILYVRQIRNTPFVDDRERNEYIPSFDFALTHNDVFIAPLEAIETVEFNAVRV